MGDSASKRHRILLVGSDVCKINRIKDHLNASAVECELVIDMPTAMKILARRSMDVMVIDSMLESSDKQRMSRLLEGLKSSHRDVRIVIFNGVSDRTLQRQIRRRGADGYLSSKNSMKSVAGSVKRLLGLTDSASRSS